MKKAIIINNESLGKGDENLGLRLMGAFLRKLWASEEKPDVIICYNSGVKLLAKGSLVLDSLNGLQEAGVEILACGTCTDFYSISGDIAAGRISNMEEIVAIMLKADSVVTV